MFQVTIGDSFRADIRFHYRGPQKNAGLKIIIGQWQGFGGLDPVGAWLANIDEWISQYPLAANADYVLYTPSVTVNIEAGSNIVNHPGIVYDMGIEVGNYPWTGHVYTKFITIDNIEYVETAESEFSGLTVTYTKL